MKDRSSFRPVEEWKSALMTLPESNFFELLRSVFGNIKTPFNKQRLLDDLFNLLSRDEIRNTIAAYIDDQDHKIIAAVALLDEPVPGELESFFKGEFSGAEIHALIINLEERLILYRFRDKETLRLALNPVLKPVLVPFASDTGLLFPCSKDEKSRLPDSREASVWISDDRIMAGLFVFIQSGEDIFRTEGGIRKKILADGKKYFPALDLDLAIRTLLRLGLFQRGTAAPPGTGASFGTAAPNGATAPNGADESYQSEDRALVPCAGKIEEYSDLSSMERQDYWAAGVYLCLNEEASDAPNGGVSGFSRSRLRVIASFIHSFRMLLDPLKRYPEVTLRRFLDLLERENDGTRKAWGFALFDIRTGNSGSQLSWAPFIKTLEMTGLLLNTGTGWKSVPGRSGSAEKNAEAAEPVMVMDSATSFVLCPEISFADAMALSRFCLLKKNSEVPYSFELTRESAVHGFDQGMDAAAMLELLGRLSGNRLDANLDWTLKDWESRYAGVSLNQGIILTLAEDRRYLAEAKPVSSLIGRNLAPGVYLLASGDKAEAVRALKKAGVDIIAQPLSGPAPGKYPRSKSLSAFSFLEFNEEDAAFFNRRNADKPVSAGRGAGSQGETRAIQDNFRRILEKMKLTKQEREELAARIDRRLVLSEVQLTGSYLRYEKLEARGLDYAGKLMIAKQAAAAGSLVEASWPGPGGKINRSVGRVQALEKKEEENILVLSNSENEAPGASGDTVRIHGDTVRIPGDTVRIPGNTVRIPVGKISLLRRIKQSIFGE